MNADCADLLDPPAGARNLLLECLGARPGERLLIVGEPPGENYYDEHVCAVIATEAHALGIPCSIVRPPLARGPDDIPEAVVVAMRDARHVVFCARLGDQIRFTTAHGKANRAMCYAYDLEHLGSEFARTPWRLFRAVHERLTDAIGAANRYRITCPLGTDLRGVVPPAGSGGAFTTFTVTPFPVVIFPPITCQDVSGRLVFDRFLMSTSINRFENSIVTLERPILAIVEDSRIVRFEGPAQSVARVEEQYRRVGAFSAGDERAVNSWHTGIYPKTFFTGDPALDIQRWGDVAFASPRYTHFHTCGAPPGNIAGSTFDATITFDDEVFWEAGRLVFLDRPDLRALLREYPGAGRAFDMRWDIGL